MSTRPKKGRLPHHDELPLGRERRRRDSRMHCLEELLLRGRQAESPPVFSLRFCAPAPYGKNREAAARSVTREGFNGQFRRREPSRQINEFEQFACAFRHRKPSSVSFSTSRRSALLTLTSLPQQLPQQLSWGRADPHQSSPLHRGPLLRVPVPLLARHPARRRSWRESQRNCEATKLPRPGTTHARIKNQHE
eukprot:COSAG06_NODE_4325_length_4365_cov_2.112518_7_plen_193_part_00